MKMKMKTREVLTITGIGLLGLNLLCTLFLLMSKKKKMTTASKTGITILLFLAVSVLTVSQFMKETEEEKKQ
jgi:hypothetical protein